MTQFDIPELAIQTFERIHQLNVTVHDLTGTLASFLKPFRFHHRSPLCLAVKAWGHSAACLDFELKALRHDLASLPEGRMHVCHAGLVEWAVPVFDEQQLGWILFAGPRLPGRQFNAAFHSRPTKWLKTPWGKHRNLPSTVENEEGHLILEHLRQLAARLQKWATELSFRHSSQNLASEFPTDQAILRQTTILRFIEDKYAQRITLPLLAKKLFLSESRASHVVRECCGASFRELLIQKRLSAAGALLRQTAMSVLEVAMASGFEDVAHFHRLFRRRLGTTPAQYRINGLS